MDFTVMSNTQTVRTRFAPSPTGFMHVGNLRTALYAFLLAKSQGGKFVLRIEDTDRNRYVENAVEVIYRTLEQAGLPHDEGPDVGGDFGPYIQSERKSIYLAYAEELVRRGAAYYCFCDKTEEHDGDEESASTGYDGRCRNSTSPTASPTSFARRSTRRESAPSTTSSSAASPSRTRCLTTRSSSNATACPPITSPTWSTIT